MTNDSKLHVFDKPDSPLSMAGLKRWSTENCARGWILTILPNGINTKRIHVKYGTRKIHVNFAIKTDHQVLARNPDLMMINKKLNKK